MKRFMTILAVAAAAALPVLFSGCGSSTTTAGSVNRIYYVRAVDTNWNYAPKNQNLTPTVANPADLTVAAGTYAKTKFIGYSTTKTLVDDAPAWRHLGIVGPAIKAEVGDTIEVHFSNETGRDLNLQPEGLLYDADPVTKKSPVVASGEKRIYRWTAVNGPGFNDTSSVVWKYRSTKDPSDENTGLLGPIIIYSKGALGSGYTPSGIREFVTLFKTFNESDGTKRTINGYMFGNMTTLAATKGERIRWYVMSGYADTDAYFPYWADNPILFMQQETNSLSLFPPRDWVVEMVPSITGEKLFFSHGHQGDGMAARYLIR
jgi:manganese oxidase